MDTKFKAKVTIEFEYDVDIENYGTGDVQKAIEIDRASFLNNPLGFLDLSLDVFFSDTKTAIEISEV